MENVAAALKAELSATKESKSLGDFMTYEDYLDEQVSVRDLYYLQDDELARQLVELGYRGSGDTLSREEFKIRKQELEELQNPSHKVTEKVLYSAGKDVSESVMLTALAEREEQIKNGKLTSIVFIRDYNSRGQEVSGYIDLAHRLKLEDFSIYFDRRAKFLPKPSDLSYFNWETQSSSFNSTHNFQVISENETGLVFKNRRDRKLIIVDPHSYPGDNSYRIELETEEYQQAVIYDHMTRRKS